MWCPLIFCVLIRSSFSFTFILLCKWNYCLEKVVIFLFLFFYVVLEKTKGRILNFYALHFTTKHAKKKMHVNTKLQRDKISWVLSNNSFIAGRIFFSSFLYQKTRTASLPSKKMLLVLTFLLSHSLKSQLLSRPSHTLLSGIWVFS